MNKIILLLMLLLVIPAVFADNSITRTFSKTQLNYGETLTITYKTSSPNVKFWAFEDRMAFTQFPHGWDTSFDASHLGGSCGIALDVFQCYAASQIAGQVTTEKILKLTAPQRDEILIFSGEWAVSDSTNTNVIKGNFDQVTVTVGEGSPPPGDLCKSWETYDEATGECVTSSWLWIILLIIIFIVIWRLTK